MALDLDSRMAIEKKNGQELLLSLLAKSLLGILFFSPRKNILDKG